MREFVAGRQRAEQRSGAVAKQIDDDKAVERVARVHIAKLLEPSAG